VYLITSSKKGISAHRLHRTLAITPNSTRSLLHCFRKALRDNCDIAAMRSKGGVVEVSNTFMGEKESAVKSGALPHDRGKGCHTYGRVRRMRDSHPRARCRRRFFERLNAKGAGQRKVEERLRMVEETFRPGNSVSLAARMHEMAPSLDTRYLPGASKRQAVP
jgi:hypothetical protein